MQVKILQIKKSLFEKERIFVCPLKDICDNIDMDWAKKYRLSQKIIVLMDLDMKISKQIQFIDRKEF